MDFVKKMLDGLSPSEKKRSKFYAPYEYEIEVTYTKLNKPDKTKIETAYFLFFMQSQKA